MSGKAVHLEVVLQEFFKWDYSVSVNVHFIHRKSDFFLHFSGVLIFFGQVSEKRFEHQFHFMGVNKPTAVDINALENFATPFFGFDRVRISLQSQEIFGVEFGTSGLGQGAGFHVFDAALAWFFVFRWRDSLAFICPIKLGALKNQD